MARQAEVFELRCGRCYSTVEIQCSHNHYCPKCGTHLQIEWRPKPNSAEAKPER